MLKILGTEVKNDASPATAMFVFLFVFYSKPSKLIIAEINETENRKTGEKSAKHKLSLQKIFPIKYKLLINPTRLKKN